MLRSQGRGRRGMLVAIAGSALAFARFQGLGMHWLLTALDLWILEAFLALGTLSSLCGWIILERHGPLAQRILLGCLMAQLLLSSYLALERGYASHWGWHLLELSLTAGVLGTAAMLHRYRYALFGC
jgi:hypothetical protein